MWVWVVERMVPGAPGVWELVGLCVTEDRAKRMSDSFGRVFPEQHVRVKREHVTE